MGGRQLTFDGRLHHQCQRVFRDSTSRTPRFHPPFHLLLRDFKRCAAPFLEINVSGGPLSWLLLGPLSLTHTHSLSLPSPLSLTEAAEGRVRRGFSAFYLRAGGGGPSCSWNARDPRRKRDGNEQRHQQHHPRRKKQPMLGCAAYILRLLLRYCTYST